MVMTSVLFGVKITSEYMPGKTDTDPAPSSNSPAVKFVLKYADGAISLFEGDAVIATFSEVNYSTLPYIDQQSLTDGIEFDNIDDVYTLIEDFDG